MRHATYELEEIGRPTLADVLAPLVDLAASGRSAVAEAQQVARVADDDVHLARP